MRSRIRAQSSVRACSNGTTKTSGETSTSGPQEISVRELLHGGDESGRFHIKASVRGEDFDPALHEGNLLIKAATYHGLSVRRENGTWQAEVIFDI